MWKCRRCGKAVYFAERKTSLGHDWHPECLRCEECGKRLNPGQHAEHKGSPYCHVPCYSVLFGPTLFGHGSRVESHTSFGRVEQRHGLPVERSHLEAKLRIYNQHHEGKSTTLQSRERNGRPILEGSLRIYWGVNNMIHLKEDHDDRMPVRRRNSHRFFMEKDKTLDLGELADVPLELLNDKKENRMSSLLEFENNAKNQPDIGRNYKTLPDIGLQDLQLAAEILDGDLKEVTLRKKKPKSKLRRRCSINGHFYNRETSVFMPSYGSVTSVWTTSLVNAPEVINMLLEKFKVENKPDDFSLYVVRDSGERRRIEDNECPLLVRVMLGPSEDVAKVFIMDRRRTEEITPEVAQFLRFTDVELKAFIQKFYEEEEKEVDRIRRKFEDLKWGVKSRLKILQATTIVPVQAMEKSGSEKYDLICHM